MGKLENEAKGNIWENKLSGKRIKHNGRFRILEVGNKPKQAKEQAGKLAIKLKAGEFALFRTGGALYAQANTSAVRVRFIVIED